MFHWRELSFADSKSTAAALDTTELKTRKVPDRLCTANSRSLALADRMISDYLKAFDFVEFKPLDANYSRDKKSKFSSLGVFAKQDLPFGKKISGVVGYLSVIARRDIEPNVNDFSLVWEKNFQVIAWRYLVCQFLVSAKLRICSRFKTQFYGDCSYCKERYQFRSRGDSLLWRRIFWLRQSGVSVPVCRVSRSWREAL